MLEDVDDMTHYMQAVSRLSARVAKLEKAVDLTYALLNQFVKDMNVEEVDSRIYQSIYTLEGAMAPTERSSVMEGKPAREEPQP